MSSPLKSEAQTEVHPYQPGITQDGITYFLPQTRLHIVVRAQRESYTPGEYAAFAQRFLDAPNVEQQPFDTWTLQQIEVVPYGVADRTQAYTIKLNHKTSAPLVELAPDGRLLSVNTTADALPTLETPSVKTPPKVTNTKLKKYSVQEAPLLAQKSLHKRFMTSAKTVVYWQKVKQTSIPKTESS